MTIPTQLVLQVLLVDGVGDQYGRQIGERAGLPSGTVHPILARLERAGWVQSRWEEVDPAAIGRPARRYYQLTREGARAAQRALARAHRPRRVAVPQPDTAR